MSERGAGGRLDERVQPRVLRVLVVEDNADDAELTQLHFAAYGGRFEVIVAPTAERGIEAANDAAPAQSFDAVVLDQSLPDADGVGALKSLRAAGHTMPVIVATGDEAVATAVVALQAGAADYVVKRPGYLDRLIPAVEAAVRRHQLERVIRERIEALAELGRLVQSTLDERELAQIVVERTVALVGAPRAGIYRHSEDGQWLEPLAAVDTSDPSQVETLFFRNPIPIDAIPLVAETARRGRTIWCEDLSKDGRGGPLIVERFDTFSLITAPLRGRNDRLIGVLGFYWTERPHPISRDQVQMVEAIARQTELALQNARWYSETQRRERQAAFLAEATQWFNAARAPYEVLQYLVEGATDLLGDTCIVYLAEEGSATLRVAAEHFRDEGSAARHRALRYEEWTRSDTGLVGAAFCSGQTQFVTDYGTEPRARPPFVEILQSVIVAPLVAGGQVLGALVTYTSPGSSRRFTTEEVSVADALASRAAQAFERAQLWASAEAERAKLEAVFEQMADGLLIFSADGKPRVINPAGKRLLGLAASDEITLAEYMRRLEPASLEGLPLPAEALPPLQALRGEVVTSTRLSVATARGERLELTMSAAPLRDGRGQIAGAVCVFRDAAPLREAERAKDQFLSIASHELKTPLTSLKGFAQLLQRALQQPDQIDRARAIRYSESVLRQSDRLAELVNDLLDVSRIQSGRLELDRRLTDLERLAGDVLDRCRGQSTSTSGKSGRQHEFVLDAPPEPLAGCWDESRLDQVLTNLVTNAIKYSPDGGEIRVRLWREDDEARVSVSDQGIGIPTDQFEELFLPFARARNAQAQHFSGFGLGLYISRDIALRHGGRLWVESVEGEGSTFYLALPLTQPIGPDGEGSESDPFREGERCDVAPARRAES